MLPRLIITLVSLFACTALFGQPTRIRGRVTDEATGEPLQFVNVVFTGTILGTTTDADGLFSFETREAADSLQFIFMGYDEISMPVKAHALNTLEVKMRQSVFGIENVVIRPGPNPAHPILDSVNKYKFRNDPAQIDRYAVSTYTKMQLDLSNVKKREFKNRYLQKNIGFILEHIDTSALTGQPYLPAMISETAAEYYHSNNPPLSREVLKANRVSGFEDNQTVASFTGQLSADVNFYDNYIELINVRFASPLSSHGRLLYNYFLVDSSRVEGRKMYKIRFHPKGTSTPVLDGEVIIDSATYALRSAHAVMPRGVNVNWVRHLVLDNDNRMVNDTLWFRKRDRLSVDFSIVLSDSSKIQSFIGTREVDYSNFRLDDIPPAVMKMTGSVVVREDITRNDDKLWDSLRPYELSEEEKSIYRMVDEVQSTRFYQNTYTIINTIIGGYWNTKHIGIGPYSKLVSFNNLEGARFQLGFRTTNQSSHFYRVAGYAAYGIRDRAFKGGGSLELSFMRFLTRKLSIGSQHDVAQLGQNDQTFSGHDFFGSVFSRGKKRMSMVDRAYVRYEHEWFDGFVTNIGTEWESIESNRFVEMVRPDGSTVPRVNNPMVQLGFRLSFKEQVMRQPFDKTYLSSDYPIISMSFTAGLKGLLPESYEYYRLSLSVSYTIPAPPAGYSELMIHGGHIFGRVPYPLLKLPEGNGTYFYDRLAFSCMNFYEFAVDSWVSLFYEHHFNGFFLGKIPLLRRLRLREVVTFKGIYGVLSHKNNGTPGGGACMLFPKGMSSLSTPYMEAGFGIENIVNLLRVDFIWRLTHRNSGGIMQNFAINAGLNISF